MILIIEITKRTCLLLCCTSFPICGAPLEDVLKMTTQRSSWQRAAFSLLLCPSWNRLNSTSVGSSTVSSVADWCGFEEKGGSVPDSRTSDQPSRTLQMSMQSK